MNLSHYSSPFFLSICSFFQSAKAETEDISFLGNTPRVFLFLRRTRFLTNHKRSVVPLLKTLLRERGILAKEQKKSTQPRIAFFLIKHSFYCAEAGVPGISVGSGVSASLPAKGTKEASLTMSVL